MGGLLGAVPRPPADGHPHAHARIGRESAPFLVECANQYRPTIPGRLGGGLGPRAGLRSPEFGQITIGGLLGAESSPRETGPSPGHARNGRDRALSGVRPRLIVPWWLDDQIRRGRRVRDNWSGASVLGPRGRAAGPRTPPDKHGRVVRRGSEASAGTNVLGLEHEPAMTRARSGSNRPPISA
jgi:hypothetical protein